MSLETASPEPVRHASFYVDYSTTLNITRNATSEFWDLQVQQDSRLNQPLPALRFDLHVLLNGRTSAYELTAICHQSIVALLMTLRLILSRLRFLAFLLWSRAAAVAATAAAVTAAAAAAAGMALLFAAATAATAAARRR